MGKGEREEAKKSESQSLPDNRIEISWLRTEYEQLETDSALSDARDLFADIQQQAKLTEEEEAELDIFLRTTIDLDAPVSSFGNFLSQELENPPPVLKKVIEQYNLIPEEERPDFLQIQKIENRKKQVEQELGLILLPEVKRRYNQLILGTDFDAVLKAIDEEQYPYAQLNMSHLTYEWGGVAGVSHEIHSLNDSDDIQSILLTYDHIQSLERTLRPFQKDSAEPTDQNVEVVYTDDYGKQIRRLNDIGYSYGLNKNIVLLFEPDKYAESPDSPKCIEDIRRFSVKTDLAVPSQLVAALTIYTDKQYQRLVEQGITLYEQKASDNEPSPNTLDLLKNIYEKRISLIEKGVKVLDFPRLLQYESIVISNGKLSERVTAYPEIPQIIIKKLTEYYQQHGIDINNPGTEGYSERLTQKAYEYINAYPKVNEFYFLIVRKDDAFKSIWIDLISVAEEEDPFRVLILAQELKEYTERNLPRRDPVANRQNFWHESIRTLAQVPPDINIDERLAKFPEYFDRNKWVGHLTLLLADYMPFFRGISRINIRIDDNADAEKPEWPDEDVLLERAWIARGTLIHEIFEHAVHSMSFEDAKKWIEIIDSIPEDSEAETKWTTSYGHKLSLSDSIGERMRAYKEDFCEAGKLFFLKGHDRYELFQMSKRKFEFILNFIAKHIPEEERQRFRDGVELDLKFTEILLIAQRRLHGASDGTISFTEEQVRSETLQNASSHMKNTKQDYDASTSFTSGTFIDSEEEGHTIDITLPAYIATL
jgi:hypothetical protein